MEKYAALQLTAGTLKVTNITEKSGFMSLSAASLRYTL